MRQAKCASGWGFALAKLGPPSEPRAVAPVVLPRRTAHAIRMSAALLVVALWAAIPPGADAALLVFDDIPAAVQGAALGTIPDGYGGFVWTAAGFIDGSVIYPAGSGYENGAVSGTYVAFNELSQITTVNGTLFTFTSAHFTAAWNNGLSLQVQGYQGGSLLFSLPEPLILGPSGPTFRAFGWAGIDELRFTASGGTNAGLGGSGAFFAMDDFASVQIPEPAPVVPLAAGLMLILALRRLVVRRC